VQQSGANKVVQTKWCNKVVQQSGATKWCNKVVQQSGANKEVRVRHVDNEDEGHDLLSASLLERCSTESSFPGAFPECIF
jgi:hypothetical protein